MKKLASFVLCSAAAIGIAAPAVAASADYYLIIDGVDGEASSAARISSWSLGASNPTSVGQGGMSAGKGASAGKPNMGHDVVSPRDSSSGMATGRVAAGDVNGDGMLDFSEAGKLDQTGPLSVTLPAGSDAIKQLCAGTTSRSRSGHIVKSDGTVYDLADMKGVCTAGAGGVTIVAMTGSMKQKEYTGHVTLMK